MSSDTEKSVYNEITSKNSRAGSPVMRIIELEVNQLQSEKSLHHSKRFTDLDE
jgi:hypothetical protein